MKYALGIRFGRYIQYYLPKYIKYNSFETNDVRLVRDIDNFDYKSLGIQYDLMAELLQKKVDLFVYFEDEKPLGMMCGYRGSCYIRGPGISLIQDEDVVYWFWIYTLPESRGKNVYKTLKNVFFAHYKDATGFTALVEPGNSIMIREMEKNGFTESKKYFYMKFKHKSVLIESSNNTKTIIFNSNKYKLFEI